MKLGLFNPIKKSQHLAALAVQECLYSRDALKTEKYSVSSNIQESNRV